MKLSFNGSCIAEKDICMLQLINISDKGRFYKTPFSSMVDPCITFIPKERNYMSKENKILYSGDVDLTFFERVLWNLGFRKFIK